MPAFNAAIRQITLQTNKRAVRVHVRPRPWNMSESRAVLKVLERYGDIVFFRNLQYEQPKPANNVVLAVYANDAAVEKLMSAQPLKFSLEYTEDASIPGKTNISPSWNLATSDDSDNLESTDLPEALATPTTPQEPKSPPLAAQEAPYPHQPPGPSPLPTRKRDFTLSVEHSHINTQNWVERQPYWNAYDVNKSFSQQDLKNSVPLIGQSDLSFRHSTTLEQRIKESNSVRDYRLTLRQLSQGMSWRDAWSEKKAKRSAIARDDLEGV